MANRYNAAVEVGAYCFNNIFFAYKITNEFIYIFLCLWWSWVLITENHQREDLRGLQNVSKFWNYVVYLFIYLSIQNMLCDITGHRQSSTLNDVTWYDGAWSILVQLIACFLVAPCHDLANASLSVIRSFSIHLVEGKSTYKDSYHLKIFAITDFKSQAHIPGDTELCNVNLILSGKYIT